MPLRVSQPAQRSAGGPHDQLGNPTTSSVPSNFRRNVAYGPTMECSQIASDTCDSTWTPAALGEYAASRRPLSTQHVGGCHPPDRPCARRHHAPLRQPRLAGYTCLQCARSHVGTRRGLAMAHALHPSSTSSRIPRDNPRAAVASRRGTNRRTSRCSSPGRSPHPARASGPCRMSLGEPTVSATSAPSICAPHRLAELCPWSPTTAWPYVRPPSRANLRTRAPRAIRPALARVPSINRRRRA